MTVPSSSSHCEHCSSPIYFCSLCAPVFPIEIGEASDVFIFSSAKCVSSFRAAPPRHVCHREWEWAAALRPTCSMYLKGDIFSLHKKENTVSADSRTLARQPIKTQSSIITWKLQSAVKYWPGLLCKVWCWRFQVCHSDNDDVVSSASFGFCR